MGEPGFGQPSGARAGNRRKNLIVNSISPELTDHQLREIFARIGPVRSAQIVKDRKSLNSLGYAFVDMANEQDAERAIHILTGQELLGYHMRANFSNRESKNKRAPTPGFRLFVQKLPPATTEGKLLELFGEFGEVATVKMPFKPGPECHCKGYAFLTFKEELDAKASIEALNGYTDEFFTTPLVVKVSVADEMVNAEKKKARVARQYQPVIEAPPPMLEPAFDPNNPPPPPPRRRKLPLEQPNLPAPPPKKLTLPEIPMNCDGVTLFFYNVGKETEETQIKRVLLSQGAGPILYVAVVREPTTNLSKNFAFVKFRNPEDAQATIATLARTDLFGCGPVDIKYKTFKSSGGGGGANS